MTITPETLPYLSDNVRYFHSIGIKNIITHFALMINWERVDLKKTLYEQMLALANFYLDNPKINECYFFKSDIANTLCKPLFNSACVHGQGKAFDYQTKRYYTCFMCFPVLAGEDVSHELSKIDFTNTSQLEKQCCLSCPFINICPTCYAENYITRGDVSNRDMVMCPYYKIIFAVLFKYEYAKLKDVESPSLHEIRKMMAIQKWQPYIESIIDDLINE